MKPFSFCIEIYNWDVTVWQLTHDTNPNAVKQLLNTKVDCPIDYFAAEIEEEIGGLMVDGAHHYYNATKRSSVVILYPMTSFKILCSVLAHELQHVMYRIVEHCKLEGTEASAYISGYIASHVYPKFYKPKTRKASLTTNQQNITRHGNERKPTQSNSRSATHNRVAGM